MECEICVLAQDLGWWGKDAPSGFTHCQDLDSDGLGCHRSWRGTAQAHCRGCHQHFTSPSAFDLHRPEGRCLHPAHVLTKDGERRLVQYDYLDGPVWGRPGDTAAQERLRRTSQIDQTVGT